MKRRDFKHCWVCEHVLDHNLIKRSQQQLFSAMRFEQNGGTKSRLAMVAQRFSGEVLDMIHKIHRIKEKPVRLG
jgi:hypothetical protein